MESEFEFQKYLGVGVESESFLLESDWSRSAKIVTPLISAVAVLGKSRTSSHLKYSEG